MKVIIIVKENHCAVLVGGENEDVGVGEERAECRFFTFGEIGLLMEGGRN